jgi:2-C-methyl-D-erythritol 4-phosphate cytidylyltransferase
MVLQAFEERIDLTITAGGETRYHSVQNGLARLPEDSLILVHDGVRPLVSKNLILQCLAQAAQNGSAIPALTATDSMRLVQQSSSILLPAFRQPYNESFTDEASVVEAAGGTIFLVKGEKRNLKITTPEDLAIAEALLNLEP